MAALLEMTPEGRAGLETLRASIGQAGIDRVARYVQADSQAAIFVREQGLAGVQALEKAGGNVAKARALLAAAADAAAAAPAAVPKLKTTPMRGFKGENLPGNPFWGGKVVKYLTDSERAAYRLQFKGGKIYDAQGKLFDTTNASSLHMGGGGKAIFIMDENGVFYASKTHAEGAFHHSSLAAGGPVAAAGELEVTNGVLEGITDRSGHYRPTTDFTQQALNVLQQNGIDISRVNVTKIGKPPTP
jgi:hypothetical protein